MALNPKKVAAPSKPVAKATKPAAAPVVDHEDDDADDADEAPVKPVAKTGAKTATATKAPVSKAKAKAKAKPAVANVFEEVSSELSALDAETAETEIDRLQSEGELNNFKLGGVLYFVNANSWFAEQGFESFKAYCEERHGVQYRKAMYLIKIYEELTESGVDYGQIAHLGWTKIKELAPVMTEDNVDEWIGIAEDLNVIQLQAYIKDKLKEGDDDNGDEDDDTPAKPKASKEAAKKLTTMTFKLHEDQREVVENALDQAKADQDTDVDAVALEAICLSYISGEAEQAKPAKGKKPPTLKAMMKAAGWEEVLNVFEELWPDITLSVEVDPEGDEGEED